MDTFERHLSLFLFFHWMFSPFFMGRNWNSYTFERENGTDLPGTNAGAQTSSVKHATPSGHSPPFALSQRLWILEWPMNEKKSPHGTFGGYGCLGFDFPPRWLGLQIEGLRIPQISTKFTGGIILPKKDNYPTSPHVERRSLSHLNCSYLCEISRNDESTSLLDSFTNFNFDFQCFWGFLESWIMIVPPQRLNGASVFSYIKTHKSTQMQQAENWSYTEYLRYARHFCSKAIFVSVILFRSSLDFKWARKSRKFWNSIVQITSPFCNMSISH